MDGTIQPLCQVISIAGTNECPFEMHVPRFERRDACAALRRGLEAVMLALDEGAVDEEVREVLEGDASAADGGPMLRSNVNRFSFQNRNGVRVPVDDVGEIALNIVNAGRVGTVGGIQSAARFRMSLYGYDSI